MPYPSWSCSALLALSTLAGPLRAQDVTVGAWHKYSQQVVDNFDAFGACVTGLGDLDGDGIGDVAVGAPGDDDGTDGNGAVWILFLNADGTIRTYQKISEISGWFEADLFVDRFGAGVAGLGDLDGDGVPDLAVAAPQSNIYINGAAWILFLRRDGTVKSWRQVVPAGALSGTQFGDSIACLGDVDGNGAVDLAFGHQFSSDGGLYAGAVWILFLANDGSLIGEQKISQLHGGFGGDLDQDDRFGISAASPGDLDGDGIPDLAVGAYGDDDGGTNAGAVWILFLRADGSARAWQKISATSGGFGGELQASDLFGRSLCAVGDLDGDGLGDLAVGAPYDDDGGTNLGAVWILHLDAAGKVKSERKISQTEGGFGGELERDPFYASDNFGTGIGFLGDLDRDGFGDLAVGTPGRGTVAGSNTDSGAAWILRMGPGATVEHERFYGGPRGGWGTRPRVHGQFGSAAAMLEDIDRDGVRDIAVGAPNGDMPSADLAGATGTAWILFPNPDGSIKRARYLGAYGDGFTGNVDRLDAFGCALASLGDLNGDGTGDLAVGAEGDDDGGANKGALWILFLRPDGRIRAQQKISETAGGFGAQLYAGGRFGSSLAHLGDLDGDGAPELAVGADGDDDGGDQKGAVWILSLSDDGTVRAWTKISQTTGGFGGALVPGDLFGSSVAFLGDLDGDGDGDLAVGAEGDGPNRGALWILFLAPDGSVAAEQRITESVGGFTGNLDSDDFFGASLAGLGDLDGDGIPDLAVGAPQDDEGELSQGAVWILFLEADGTVRAQRKIAERLAGFGGQLSRNDRFGTSVTAAVLGQDGGLDLLVGAALDGNFVVYGGGLWGLALDRLARR